jgi:AraC family transcriptional regulator
MDSKSADEYRSRMEKVVTFITTNLNQTLDLEQLARASCFSPYHFHRIFSAILGETPQDFVNRLRLETAANLLLKTPSFSITQVAFTCGFSSSTVFARSFKKHFGVTASEYARGGAYQTDRQTGSPSTPLITLDPLPEVRVSQMPELHLAYTADLKGYNLENICRSWERLFRWASARGLVTPQSKMVGISYDDPLITSPEKCRYYACITVPYDLQADRMVGVLDIPACRCAVCHLVCSSEQIEQGYRFLYREWFPDSGMQPVFPCYEIYHETPETNADGRYVMDICIAVEPL